MADKPLHVQVAEALGWTNLQSDSPAPADLRLVWVGVPPGHMGELLRVRLERGDTTRFWPIPHYDSDWSAIGPLIEKLHISIMDEGPKWKAMVGASDGYDGLECDDYETGPTPLQAVCSLILQLHKTGELPQNV